MAYPVRDMLAEIQSIALTLSLSNIEEIRVASDHVHNAALILDKYKDQNDIDG